MKQFRLNDPEGINSLELVERDEPKPASHEVLVRVHATSLNYRDLMVVEGRYARGASKPDLVPLSDGAGEVVTVGDGVSRFKVGDRVAAIFMQRWIGGAITPDAQASALGGAIDGMLSEYVVLHEEGLVPVPNHLSYAEAATLPCAAVTAWHALVTQGHLSAGETVLVLGSGGVSVFALQFAKLFGANVIATSSSDDKLLRLQALGASGLINYTNTPDWNTAVLDLTGGTGADHIVEVGGAGTLTRSLACVRVDGFVYVIGLLSGAAEIDPMPILRRMVTVQGVYVGSREMYEAMNRAIEAHQLCPVIDRSFPLEDTREAFAYFKSQAHFGKVVIALA
tara:strand:+ start:454 stop:1467 length:1014 start_codon:yes stop_codon:yes gene_type:complete